MQVNWLLQTLNQVPSERDWLHPSEQEVLRGFKFAKRRNDWLLGRWTAKNCVTKNNEPLDSNISSRHSHGVAISALCPQNFKIGCDLEKIEPRSHRFIQDYFTVEEKEIIYNYGKEDVPLLANLLWSAKESVLKSIRLGLRVDTRKIQINSQLDKNVKEWNEFEIHSPELKNKFYGRWQKFEGFVITMVCDQKDFRLVKSCIMT